MVRPSRGSIGLLPGPRGETFAGSSGGDVSASAACKASATSDVRTSSGIRDYTEAQQLHGSVHSVAKEQQTGSGTHKSSFGTGLC